MFFIYILAFLAGLPAAWAWGRYLFNVEKRRAGYAAAWDFLILLLSKILTLTLWSITGNSIWILIVFALGNALGTFLVVYYEDKYPRD